jgi:hypothetical protein
VRRDHDECHRREYTSHAVLTVSFVSHSPLPTCVHAQSAMSSLDDGPAVPRMCWRGSSAVWRTSRDRSGGKRIQRRILGNRATAARRGAPVEGDLKQGAMEGGESGAGMMQQREAGSACTIPGYRALRQRAWLWRDESSGGGGQPGLCCGR